MSGVIAGAAEKLKPITPKPARAAFSYVGGLPAACHIGGCVCFLRQRDVVHERDVLVIGVLRDARVGDVPLQEKAEFHLVGSSRTWAKAYAGGRSPVKNTF